MGAEADDLARTEVERIRGWLKARVTSRSSLRAVERKLGVKGGGVRHVLRGEQTLSLQHILALLEAVGIDPGAFFRSAYPDQGLPPPAPQQEDEAAAEAREAALEEELEKALGRVVLRALRFGGDSAEED